MSDTDLAVGERFTMTEKAKAYEFRENDRLLARFLPGYTYTVTGKNMKVAQKFVKDGEATKGGLSLEERAKKAGISLGALKGDVKAVVNVDAKRSKRNKEK